MYVKAANMCYFTCDGFSQLNRWQIADYARVVYNQVVTYVVITREVGTFTVYFEVTCNTIRYERLAQGWPNVIKASETCGTSSKLVSCRISTSIDPITTHTGGSSIICRGVNGKNKGC